MIARLRGELLESGGGRVVVDAGGVGYEVDVAESVLVALPGLGERVDLHIRQVFREDGTSLYGFLEAFDRRMFDLVTEVKGCGPKVALSLLDTLGADGVAGGIGAQDAKSLTRASGVGMRLAERIILELKEKVQAETLMRRSGSATRTKAAPPDDELVEALMALGYRRPESEKAAIETTSDMTLQDRLKAALRNLQR